MSKQSQYHDLASQDVDPARLKRERAKAAALRKTSWWLTQINRGLCHYCGKKFAPKELTMDHVVPLARGGMSTKGNIVPACKSCNRGKSLDIPAESLLSQIESERKGRKEE